MQDGFHSATGTFSPCTTHSVGSESPYECPICLRPAAKVRKWGLLSVPFARSGQYCRECGYDLTGNVSGRCPECGRAIVASASEKYEVRMESGE